MSDSENQMEMFTSIISSLAGPERMERDRPFVGQSQTTLGQRGSMQIVGMRARDLMDCYIRAVIFSYPVTDENGKDINAILAAITSLTFERKGFISGTDLLHCIFSFPYNGKVVSITATSEKVIIV